MAPAANLWNTQAPLGADGTASRIDIVGVMTVIAGCVGIRLVLDVWPGMNRFHVAFDLLYHHPQPRILLCLILVLSGLPQILVALYATDLQMFYFLVWYFRNFLVTLDAKPLSMHAFSKLVRNHVQ